ncbi:MAG: ABC transporter permease [Kangiellaceae bacterium]|nr:ABC transporter permease [Kangiellaceae bacterium]MCW8997133.1 ABC transporter permease [Kangiellaceae bacterium]
MFNLIYLELLKTKRSLAFLMMLLSPAAVVLVNSLLLINNEGAMVAERGWSIFWLSNYSMWGYFTLPLYIALITALLNGIEHKVGGWRSMLSMPLSQWQLFIAKFILAWLYVLGANLVLFLQVSLVIGLFTLVGYQGIDWWSLDISVNLAYTLGACMAILIIQHMVSWHWENIVAPLTLGVIATMSIVQVGSSKYWKYDPWTYLLMATNGANSENRLWAIGLAVGCTLICLVISKFWLGRREITC